MSDRHRDWPVKLAIDPEAFIAPGAVVVGEVTLGARASIWFNTVVRGDSERIEIGDDTNVQDNSTVHVDEGMPAIVGKRVTIGHRAIVHGCVIGDDCLIGMGAVVLSGARIGAGSLIGASALVREGQVIPPGSLAVGSPAKVIGPVSDAHRAAIATGATHYVELSRAYLAKGFARPHPGPGEAAGASAWGPPPLTWEEWARAIGVLAGSPEVIAARLAAAPPEAASRRPGPGAWSAHEVVGHLRDCDVEVFAPRLERALTTTRPAEAWRDMTEDARVSAYAALDTAALLAQWREARARCVARLAPLGPAEWSRVSVHSVRGTVTLGDQVRGWVEHDLGHRRQLARALEHAS